MVGMPRFERAARPNSFNDCVEFRHRFPAAFLAPYVPLEFLAIFEGEGWRRVGRLRLMLSLRHT